MRRFFQAEGGSIHQDSRHMLFTSHLAFAEGERIFKVLWREAAALSKLARAAACIAIP